MHPTLTYVHDPMCSWCYAFRPVWEAIVAGLPDGVRVRRLLGGLAPDNDRPMPEELRAQLQATWRRIRQVVPGTEFNFAFWTECAPRRSTYPACRAVLAAMRQGAEHEVPMVHAIQHAYYREARNPSDADTLVALAGALGLDRERFAADLDRPETRAELARQIAAARALGVDSFPSLVLETADGPHWLAHHYTDPAPVLGQLGELLRAAAAAAP